MRACSVVLDWWYSAGRAMEDNSLAMFSLRECVKHIGPDWLTSKIYHTKDLVSYDFD